VMRCCIVIPKRHYISIINNSPSPPAPPLILLRSQDAEVLPLPAEPGAAPAQTRWSDAAVVAFASDREAGQLC
jgi:hypothetical protein